MMSSTKRHENAELRSTVTRSRNRAAWSTQRRTSYKTPYGTIFKRRIQQKTGRSVGRRKSFDLKQAETISKDLIVKTLICYSCSPLFQFHTDEESLSRYSHNLSGYLSTQVNKNTYVFGVEGRLDIFASISLIKGLPLRKGEPDAIKIVLKRRDEKVVAEMYLCSVDVSTDMRQFAASTEKHKEKMTDNSFLFLPLLLGHGLVKLRSAVICWLQENFDCCVELLKFSQVDLNWMMSMWNSIPFQPKKEEKKHFLAELTWKIPKRGLGLDKIHMEMELETVKAMWECIEREDKDEVTLENVKQFMKTLYEHLFFMFHIRFSAFSLISISSPFVRVSNEGKIKMCSSKHVHTVLAHLSCIAAERLNWKITDTERTDHPFMEGAE